MNLPTRHAVIGMALGALAASVIAVTGPGMSMPALASEVLGMAAAPGFDPNELVKFNERQYRVQHEDWVGTEPLSSVRVKKIEGGRVSHVTITTTATGTYSTDAMFSRHVRYAGIAVDEQRVPNRFWFWSKNGWSGFSSQVANSFVYSDYSH